MPKRGRDLAEEPTPKQKRRVATVYDAVAGNIGLNGFLSEERKASNATRPLAPEEVLLKHAENTNVSAHHQPLQQYDKPRASLPDSDLLKAIHEYAGDFYEMATKDHGKHDIKSMDGSALVAVGCLLEEASRQLLGENGDMVLVEPTSLGKGMRETQRAKYQVIGKVEPPATPEPDSEISSTEDEQEPAKKRRV